MADVIPITEQVQAASQPVQPAQASPTQEQHQEQKSRLDVMQKRLNDLGDMMVKRLDALKPASSANAGETGVAPKKLEGAAALEEAINKAQALQEKATQKAIRASIVSAMVSSGVEEGLARKTLVAMQQEAKFSVNEDTDEVFAEDTSGTRKAGDFVKIILQRDDWRGLITQKVGAKPVSRGGTAPAQSGMGTLQPGENGIWDAGAIRSAAGIS
jgi:hypothetical protein